MQENGIRELSLEELALVSGGAQMDTTDLPPVDALPPDDGGWPDIDPPDWTDPWDPGDGGGGGGGGGGGEAPPSAYEQVDAQADTVAREVEALIKADPGYQSQELGTVIYRDAVTGEIKTSPLARGDASNPGAISYPLLEWGITPGQVVGIIHSHPAGVFPSETHEVNKYPSDNRTVGGVAYEGGDWGVADLLRDNGMNAEEFRYYIIGPDGVTREYDFNDRDAETLGTTL
ncbi:hypothetical protein JAK58_02725 [Stenotrophomonas maltophilia]|uniref:hypothetical protein n=1 Tax=Stenotrophomonas TaxID=40323 RepID=UPI001873DD09|nr:MULTISPECIES: hypothetical protein [Stenotrophomonas]MBE5271631.1 hypothetical protein [Stenotrophomonas sp. B2]MCU1090427.1 hypothetical protein [Stenotrophomonas maltophilia]MDI9248488.1 hypothetical protein [Stenotrophomonas sp. RS-48]